MSTKKKVTSTEEKVPPTNVRKLSVRAVLGDVVKRLEKGELLFGVPLVRFIGSVQSVEMKATQYGDSTCFNGVFECVDLTTGEAYTSNKCYLPGDGEAIVSAKFNTLGNNEQLRFAFDVVLEKLERGIGYGYIIKPLVDDGIDLLADFKAGLPMLPLL